jgi:hypothetical protein
LDSLTDFLRVEQLVVVIELRQPVL